MGNLRRHKTCKYWHSEHFIIMHLIRSDPKCLRYCFKLPWCLPSEPDLQNIKCCVQWLYMMKAVYTIRWQQYKFTKESETSSAICESNKCLKMKERKNMKNYHEYFLLIMNCWLLYSSHANAGKKPDSECQVGCNTAICDSINLVHKNH